jgi:hypothetical protein
MIITCIKDSKWQIGGAIKSFAKDQDLEVGVDIPDHIAEDMLRCDYAIAKKGMPRIETKEKAVMAKDDTEKLLNKESSISVDDITSDMTKKDLELYAREKLDRELDRRKSLKVLHAEVIEAIKEKNNE